MLEASQMPDLKGTVDVVNTVPFYPMELDLLKQVRDSFEKGTPEHEKAIMGTPDKTPQMTQCFNNQ